MRIIGFVVCGSLLAGCATSPHKIRAAYVSPHAYQNMTCHEVDTEILAVDAKAGELQQRLSRRANGDNWKMGIGLLVAWPALLFLKGNNSAEGSEYAQLKGNKDALIAARRDCIQAANDGSRSAIPGTIRIGRLTLVPAETPSGVCIIAPANYAGTGAQNSPAITSATPRCSSLTRN